jgi:hypothetical protein
LIVEKGARRLRLRATDRQEELFAYLKARRGVDGLRWDNDCLTFRLEGTNEDDMARLLNDLVIAGYPIVRFAEEQSTLESAYLNVTASDGDA